MCSSAALYATKICWGRTALHGSTTHGPGNINVGGRDRKCLFIRKNLKTSELNSEVLGFNTELNQNHNFVISKLPDTDGR